MKIILIITIAISMTLATTYTHNDSLKRNQNVKSCALQANYNKKSPRDNSSVWKNCTYCMERIAFNETNNIKNLLIKGCVRKVKQL